MESNPLIVFIKRRKVLSVSIAIILMVAAWGISYYALLAKGNSTYLTKSKEIIGKVNQINSNLEDLSSKMDFLDGNISGEFRAFIDNSSKDILKLQNQFSDLKYTLGYRSQAKNIDELLNQEVSALNITSYIVSRPLDFENAKKMNDLKDSTSKIESLVYQIDMPSIMDKSNSLQGLLKNLGVFLNANSSNSVDEAYKTAKRELGGNIIHVIPFAFNDKNYIVVRLSQSKENLGYNVIILQSQGSEYVEIWRNPGGLPLSDGDLQSKLFTVQDVDGDGKPDVTYFDQGSGTGGSGAELSVYSVAKNVEYSISVNNPTYYTKVPGQQIQISDNLKKVENKTVYDWITNTLVQNQIIVPKITDEDLLNDPNLAGELWYKENVDLHGSGKTKIHWYDGVAPNKAGITAEVRDGTMDYKAFFKDGVYATDTQNNKFYVVYIPESQYNWIERLELSDNKLIMYTRQNDNQPGITYYFNKATQELSNAQ